MSRHAFAAALLLLIALPANAGFEASLDLRVVSSDGRDSFLDGGFGKLRFDSQDDGVQLGVCGWPGTAG